MNSMSVLAIRKLRALTLPLMLLIALIVSLPIDAGAQRVGVGGGEDKTIDSKTQAEIIDSVAQALNEVYVFANMAKKMEKHIRKQYKKKTYKDIISLVEFTRKLTEDLQEVSDDKHLRVSFAPDEMLTTIEGDTLTDDEKQRWLTERRRDNFCFKEIKILDGNIGYVDLRCFSDAADAGPTAVAAMNFLAYADAIIFDLRKNGGGSPSMIQLISSYLFDEPVHLNSFYIRKSDSIQQFWSHAYVEGPRLTDVDLYVLTSERTFSAAEEFTYNLKNLERATIIGETTGGGAHPVDMKIFSNLNVRMSLPSGRAVNPITGTNWEGTGVTPHIEVPQEKALDVAHMEALKTLLAKAVDPDGKQMREWAAKGLDYKLNPHIVDEAALKEYAGQYGPRKITFENGELIYQRGENPGYKVIPLDEDIFILQGLDYFRIEFVRDVNGNVDELIGHYADGHTDGHKKDR